MRRLYFLTFLLLMLITASLALSQTSTPDPVTDPSSTPEIAFAIESDIARALPRKIVYDPMRERMVVADAYNRLLLIDALDYSTLAVLHERGLYSDVAFSHDGRWLVVLNDLTVELWDTETAELVATLRQVIGNANRLTGPIAFSSNDEVLLFYGIYPAPPALRRSENDTISYPWVWHLPAARGEAPSTLPNGVEAIQMFDYANGFVLTPDDRIVAALPSRLRVLDAFTLEQQYEIPTARYEQDPLTIWRSLRDDRIYVSPLSSTLILQVDTARQALVEFPLNSDLSQDDLDLIVGLELGSTARVIGGQAHRDTNPLLSVFLGTDYRDSRRYGSRPLTVTLVDLLLPPATTPDNVLALLFVYDETSRVGQFMLSRGNRTQQIVLSPDGEDLLIRRQDGDEYVITYDLDTGQEVRRFLPALRAIGSYNRATKNRVLAYDLSGEIVISDFQRLNAETNAVLAEDLRYSRQFDRFFFSGDSQKVITLAGTEWREWSIETGEVLRRGVMDGTGSIIATSTDGYRYLTQYSNSDGTSRGVQVTNMDTGERYSVNFDAIPGSTISEVRANPTWTRFLVVYSSNSYGPYYPGNQIAMYDYQQGFRWLIAGDDLPPSDFRSYGWVDEQTVFVYGQGAMSAQPSRVYGAEYDGSGLPACIVKAYPEQTESFLLLWERLLYFVDTDNLNELTLRICDQVPNTVQAVEQLLQLTPTPAIRAATGVPTGEVPQCLLDRYPGSVDAYSEIWRGMTAGMTTSEALELAALLCEGIGAIPLTQEFDPSLGITMLINSETGERASGDYRPPVQEQNPLQPIHTLFERTERRSLGTAILSPNRQLVAASSLPGELIVYRMIVSYDALLSQLTATAAVQLTAANPIYALPSQSPTYNIIGTPRPTLTVTPEQTLFPRPQEDAFVSRNRTEDLCPSETLFSVADAPVSYAPSGRIYALFSDNPLWIVEPENGTRREAPEITQCSRGVNCTFSPDRQWILAETYDLLYVIRPDDSDVRVLWDYRTPDPPTPIPRNIYWSGANVLEWEAVVPVTIDGTPTFRDGYARDVLNVFPDPIPWAPDIDINGIPAAYVSRQPGGPWAVAYTTYSTGTQTGYRYYLYNTDNGGYVQFAQSVNQTVGIYWHPLGDRMYYSFGNSTTYQIGFPELQNQRLGNTPGGMWSNDGRYTVFSTDRRDQPVGVWDSETGRTRTYCVPETGARLYEGSFTWSPDNQYVALQAPLPRDESQEGVGQHTMILNVETGEIVDLTTGILQIVAWAQEPGTYGSGDVLTPTPLPTASLTPTTTPMP